MTHTFRIEDRVAWNSEAGLVTGMIIKVHTQDVDYKGYTNHATEDDPQYEIASVETTGARSGNFPGRSNWSCSNFALSGA